MVEQFVSLINIILILAGCLVVLLSILFSGRLSRRIQKIEIQKLGINFSVDAVTLFVIVGLAIGLSGLYLYDQDVETMSAQMESDTNKINDLNAQLAAKGTVVTCKFSLQGPDEIVNDDSVQYFYSTEKEQSLIPLNVKKQVVVVDPETNKSITYLRAQVTLNANDAITIQAQRGDEIWQSVPFRPSGEHKIKLVDITGAVPVTPSPDIPRGKTVK